MKQLEHDSSFRGGDQSANRLHSRPVSKSAISAVIHNTCMHSFETHTFFFNAEVSFCNSCNDLAIFALLNITHKNTTNTQVNHQGKQITLV